MSIGPSVAFLTPPPLPAVRTVSANRPLAWLGLAWKDLSKAPLLSLAHGLILILIGAVIWGLGHNHFWWMAGAFSGFLVVGPMVATSLYAMSRALERGETADGALICRTWTQWKSRSETGSGGYWCMVKFGLLLALAATGWMVVSASLITVMSPLPVRTLQDFIQHIVLGSDGQIFVLWMALGSFLAAPIFASSVVALPLMLDRQVTVHQAVLTSWSVVLANPGPMALWAIVIVLLTLLGLGSYLLGLILVMPLLGHASWHAYRELVDASDFASRGDTMESAD